MAGSFGRTPTGGDGEDRAVESDSDPTAGARRAIAEVGSKLRFSDGLDGITEWMDSVSAIVDGLSGEELDRTRAEIRSLIEQLLELNAQVQNLVRLKQLLS